MKKPKSRPAINPDESPLYRLFRRKDPSGKSLISEFQFAAGERLRADFEYANFERKLRRHGKGREPAH